ncbi:MAG TPA: hypothetical protein VI454_16990 [Verrucomicrobiae bacterium]|jgi:hypothetical protein
MDATTKFALITLGAIVVFAVIIIALFKRFPGKFKAQLDTKLGKLKLEGENAPPATAVPAGVKVKGKAGRDVVAHSSSAAGVDVDATADGNIKATHTPGASSPPKT